MSLDTFYRAINKVERSLIRVDADEVTYNLHVMLRFDLELDLLEGRLAVKDLPRVWRERFEADFGIPVPDDRNGVLQDVHWYSRPDRRRLPGLHARQRHERAVLRRRASRRTRRFPAQIAGGEFGTLRGWLRENIYQHGAKFTAAEVMQRATGQPMSIEPYMDYLWNKYQPLYRLEERERTAVGVA